MDVVNVPVEVAIITNRMFPESTLPKSEFAVLAPSNSRPCRYDSVGKTPFDQTQPN